MNGRTKKRTAAALLALIAAMSLSSCAPAEIVARWFKYDIDSVTGEDGWGEHIEKRLINAIEKQDHELLEKYLQEGTDPELIDLANFEPDEKDPHYPPSWRSYSPLFMASWTGDVESVRILLKYGADPNNVWGYCGGWHSSPLYIALGNYVTDGIEHETQTDIARLLLEAGAKVDQKWDKAHSPMINAAWAQNPEAIRLLAQYGADPDFQMYDGTTALMKACTKPDMATITALTECGADPDIRDSKGRTALMMLVYHRIEPETVECIRYLLKNGADPTIKDNDGCDVLYYINGWENNYSSCSDAVDTSVVCELIDGGADVYFTDCFGRTLLHKWRGSKELVEVLLKYGVNTERKDYFGKTALDRLKETDRSNDSEAYRDYYGQIIEMLENAKKEAASNEE